MQKVWKRTEVVLDYQTIDHNEEYYIIGEENLKQRLLTDHDQIKNDAEGFMNDGSDCGLEIDDAFQDWEAPSNYQDECCYGTAYSREDGKGQTNYYRIWYSEQRDDVRSREIIYELVDAESLLKEMEDLKNKILSKDYKEPDEWDEC